MHIIDRLHASFPEALASYHCRALVALQRSRNDFGGRGGTFIYKHYHWIPRLGIRGICRLLFKKSVTCPYRRNDHSFFQKLVGDRNRLVQETAWVIAHIQNKPAEAR